VLFEQILFFVFAVMAIGGALGVILFTKNPFYSVLALVVHLVALAGLFLLLRAEFIALAQVVVYAGAVMVLYVFVVAYIGGADQPLAGPRGTMGVLGPIFALVLLLELVVAVLGSSLAALDEPGAASGPGFGSTGQIGELLLSRFLVAFEAASFLLLVAAVGAVVLARRRREAAGAMPGEPATSLGHGGRDEVARGDRAEYLPSASAPGAAP
jgi:NADH:ubiquinone oxidoreductase subunit 6 (subunit J)